MNIVIFSNAPIKKITEALNLPFSPKEGWVSAAIAMLQTVECNSCDSAAWDKLYKVKLFKGRRYPFGVLHEDLNFTSKLFSESDKIVLTGMPLYNYLIRENSICNKPFTTQKFDIYEQAKLNCQFVRDTYKELEEKAKYFLFRCTCTLLQSASDAAQISEKDLKRVKELARTQLSTAILNRFVPLGERKYYFELLYKVCIKKK